MSDYVADLKSSIETELGSLRAFFSVLVQQPRFVQLEAAVIRQLPEQFHRLDAIRDSLQDLVFFGDVLDETRREVDRVLGRSEAAAPDFEAEEDSDSKELIEEIVAEKLARTKPAPVPVAACTAIEVPQPSFQAIAAQQYDLGAIWG